MSLRPDRPFITAALFAVVLCGATALPAAGPAPASFDRYHSPQEVNAALAALHAANPDSTTLHRIAVSAGGTELTAIEVGPGAGKKGRRGPAVFVVANLEGNYPVATEAALYLADLLLRTPDSTRDLSWIILPGANPDAASRYHRKPLVADARNASSWNDDMDDRADEDGPDDLDANGVISTMRKKDPAGEWVPVEREPRLMRKADASKGERGIYVLYTEGTDNDGDGEYNEDGPGGANIGITFPHLFRPFTADAGQWPGSQPETFGIMKFAIDHPEIAMTVTLGATNLCLQPPAGGRPSSFDAKAIKVPEPMAKQFGADPARTYTMDEILEMVRPFAPPGFEITEGMVAQFLGLGAIVNPLEDDLKVYKELSEQYKEFLKAAGLDGKRLEPPQPKDGSFELWSYYHLGVPTFSLDLWTAPEAKADDKEKTGITPESLEAMTPEAFVALGEEKIAAFLKEVGAPDDVKAAMLLEGVKSGKMSPKQMAGMLKQMPKPKEPGAADAKEQARLAFSDAELQGAGFLAWKPFNHPQLGEVEIGGFVPFGDTTPPPARVQKLVEGQVPWLLQLAGRLPRLAIGPTRVEPKGAGVYAVTAWVGNGGRLPFPTAMGKKNKHVQAAIVTLEGKGLTLLSGRRRTPVSEVESGRSVKLEWLVQAAPRTSLDLTLESANAWGGTTRVVLDGAQGGAK